MITEWKLISELEIRIHSSHWLYYHMFTGKMYLCSLKIARDVVSICIMVRYKNKIYKSIETY